MPFIVRGPEVPRGGHCTVPVVGHHLFPTLAELPGVTEGLSEVLDGGSLVELFHGSSEPVELAEPGLLLHFPHHQGPETPQSALLQDAWKLFEFYKTGTTQLFNLGRDPGEKGDLTASEPERSAAMREEPRRRLTAGEAAQPTTDPGAREGREKRQKKPGKGGDKNKRKAGREER